MNTPYDEALKEMHREDPDVHRAVNLLSKAHEAGDHRATYALGTWYLHGKPPVIQPDAIKAEAYLKSAADAGVPEALFDMAVSYEKGELGEPDFPRALESYLKAALRGDAQSIYEVGRCYFYGIGVEADPAIASLWIARASELRISGLI